VILKAPAEIDRFVANPPKDVRAAVIYGRDRGAVRERADALARKLVPDPNDPFAVGQIGDGDADDAGRLADELSAMSLLGGARLVRLQAPEKAAADRIAADALKTHLSGGFNPDAFLLIEAGALGRDSGLRKAAESAKTGAVCIPIFEDEVGDLSRMTREGLARDGVALTSEALDIFVGRLPRERGIVRQEIERLALFLGPGSGVTADAAALTTHLGVTADASLSDAASFAAGGKAAPAYAGLQRAMAEGEGGVAAVRAMGFHLGRLRRIRVAVEGGAAPEAAAKSAGVFWKQEREVLRQHRAWTSPALDRAQADILAADKACKTAGSPDVLLAERLYLSVASQARRLGL
jgi:DNA polymerase-3 subunit delta